MLEYGCEAWKSNLEMFTAMQAKAQERLQSLKKEIQDVNWERKDKQLKAGEKLKVLEAQWVHLVSKNYEIEQACAKLEEEIHRKQPKKTQEEVSEGVEKEAQLPEEDAHMKDVENDDEVEREDQE